MSRRPRQFLIGCQIVFHRVIGDCVGGGFEFGLNLKKLSRQIVYLGAGLGFLIGQDVFECFLHNGVGDRCGTVGVNMGRRDADKPAVANGHRDALVERFNDLRDFGSARIFAALTDADSDLNPTTQAQFAKGRVELGVVKKACPLCDRQNEISGFDTILQRGGRAASAACGNPCKRRKATEVAESRQAAGLLFEGKFCARVIDRFGNRDRVIDRSNSCQKCSDPDKKPLRPEGRKKLCEVDLVVRRLVNLFSQEQPPVGTCVKS